MNAIVQYAVEEAQAYVEGGMDGIIVENSWDLPFLRPEDIWHETVATMSVVADSVREATSLPIGINVLANAGEAAIAVAKASRASFIRVNQWVNAYVSNEGIVQGNSAKILRYRAVLQAQDVAIFADVHVNMALTRSLQTDRWRSRHETLSFSTPTSLSRPEITPATRHLSTRSKTSEEEPFFQYLWAADFR